MKTVFYIYLIGLILTYVLLYTVKDILIKIAGDKFDFNTLDSFGKREVLIVSYLAFLWPLTAVGFFGVAVYSRVFMPVIDYIYKNFK